MTHRFPSDTDEPIDERLEALHDALLENRGAPSGPPDATLAGAEQCLKLLERVRKQSSPRDSDWLFGSGSSAPVWRRPAADLPLASLPMEEVPLPRTIGRFLIERRIGEGGFGVVFLAVDPALSRRVALKLPRPETIVSSTWREHFLREAEAAALLDHPGIVPVYEVGRAGSLCYIVQGWCDGVSLAAWLAARNGPVSPLAAAHLAQSLAESVQHAHSRGVLHRDIKPSNILLETRAGSTSADSLVKLGPAVDTVVVHSAPTVSVGAAIAAPSPLSSSSDDVAAFAGITEDQLAAVARLADFGLARLVDRGEGQTQSGAVVGTPSYMAPEQAEGLTRQIGVTADVYSLGAVLFELLTGRPPFQEESLLATLQAVREREAPRPRQRNREIPLDLDAICCKCLEKDQRRRYATAQALADDLSRFLRGENITARRAGPLERLGRWCRRKPLLASLSVATVLLAAMLLLGSTAATMLLSQQRQKTLDHLQDAIVARDQATRNEDLALAALYEARVAQVQAQRRSGQVGQRLGSLDAAAAAARLLPRLKRGESDMLRLRNEVIACLSLVDLAADKDWSDSVAPGRAVTTDGSVTHFVHGDREWRFLIVRRMEDGQVVQRLEIADDCVQVFKIIFSPSGQFLAAWCRLRSGWFSVQVWQLDPAEGADQSEAGARPPLARLKVMAGGEQWPFAFSPDSQWLAIAQSGGSVALFSVPECKQEKSLGGKVAIDALCFDPASQNLALARRGRIELISVESGKHIRSMTTGSFTYHLAFSPDGALVAAAATDKRVRLWNVIDGKPCGVLEGHGAQVTRVAFHPSGRFVATTGYDHTTRLWDVDRTRQILHMDGDLTTLSADGQWLGAGASRHRIVLPSEHRAVNVPASQGTTRTAAQQLSFEPTGRYLAASNVDQVAIVDLNRHRVSAVQRLAGTFAKFDATGRSLIASGTNALLRFPVSHEQVGEQVKTRIDPAQPLLPSSAGLLSLSADGNVVALADRFTKPQILVHRVAENVTHTLQPHHRGARWLSVSADGKLLATSTWHGHDVHVWDIQAAELVKTLPADSARVMFSPDGQQLVVNESAQVTVWRVADWTPLHPPVAKSVAAVPGPIAFSPDSRWLAILDAPSKIRLLDSNSLAELATFKLDSERFIEELVIDPQGSRLIAGTNTPGSIHVWNLPLISQRLRMLGLAWGYGSATGLTRRENIPAAVKLTIAEPKRSSVEK